MSGYEDLIRQSEEGLVVLRPGPPHRAIQFLDVAVPESERTPLTEELLNEVADEYQAWIKAGNVAYPDHPGGSTP